MESTSNKSRTITENNNTTLQLRMKYKYKYGSSLLKLRPKFEQVLLFLLYLRLAFGV